MELNTTAAVISLARKLEEDGARFYDDLSQRYDEARETWLAFAKDNRRNIVQVERAYYEVITDAIEGCFAFRMNSDDYSLEVELAQNATYSFVLGKAIEIEGRVTKFYSDAAQQSKALLADVPRVFEMVARKRYNRKAVLESLISGEKEPNT